MLSSFCFELSIEQMVVHLFVTGNTAAKSRDLPAPYLILPILPDGIVLCELIEDCL